MTHSRRSFLGGALVPLFAPLALHAQVSNYPDKPIRMIMPFAPGGVTTFLPGWLPKG